LPGTDPGKIAESAAHQASKGQRAFKLDPVKANSTLEVFDLVEEIFKRIREAVGHKCEIMLGTHGQLPPRRDPPCQAARALRAGVVRGADPAGEHR
jgi:L-alanine-DL-glutamate epimerase-like enolase superfamily enzyme